MPPGMVTAGGEAWKQTVAKTDDEDSRQLVTALEETNFIISWIVI